MPHWRVTYRDDESGSERVMDVTATMKRTMTPADGAKGGWVQFILIEGGGSGPWREVFSVDQEFVVSVEQIDH